MARPFGVKPKLVTITAPVSAGSGWIDSTAGLVQLVDPTRKVFLGTPPESDDNGGMLYIRSDSSGPGPLAAPISLQSTWTGIAPLIYMETTEGGNFEIAQNQGKWRFGPLKVDVLPGFAELEAQENFRHIDGSFSYDGALRHRIPTGQGRLDYKVGGSGVTSLLVLSGFNMTGVSNPWNYDRDQHPLPYRQWLYRGYGKFTRNAGDLKLSATLEADATENLFSVQHTPSGNTCYYIELLITIQGETPWSSDGTYTMITTTKFQWLACIYFATDTTTAQPVTMYMQRGSKTGFAQHDEDIQLYIRGGFTIADSANSLEKFADSMHFT